MQQPAGGGAAVLCSKGCMRCPPTSPRTLQAVWACLPPPTVLHHLGPGLLLELGHALQLGGAPAGRGVAGPLLLRQQGRSTAIANSVCKCFRPRPAGKAVAWQGKQGSKAAAAHAGRLGRDAVAGAPLQHQVLLLLGQLGLAGLGRAGDVPSAAPAAGMGPLSSLSPKPCLQAAVRAAGHRLTGSQARACAPPPHAGPLTRASCPRSRAAAASRPRSPGRQRGRACRSAATGCWQSLCKRGRQENRWWVGSWPVALGVHWQLPLGQRGAGAPVTPAPAGAAANLASRRTPAPGQPWGPRATRSQSRAAAAGGGSRGRCQRAQAPPAMQGSSTLLHS